jgi:hypothetical protein
VRDQFGIGAERKAWRIGPEVEKGSFRRGGHHAERFYPDVPQALRRRRQLSRLMTAERAVEASEESDQHRAPPSVVRQRDPSLSVCSRQVEIGRAIAGLRQRRRCVGHVRDSTIIVPDMRISARRRS